MGILRRASKRGKKLPDALRIALQDQSGFMENGAIVETDGKDPVEILRALRAEIGDEAFARWHERAYGLVSQKILLLCGLQEGGGCPFAEGKAQQGAYCDPQCPVRYLWESGIYGDKMPDGQYAMELSAFVQKLSRKRAQREIYLYYLRSAFEGTLAGMEGGSAETCAPAPGGAISFQERAGKPGGGKGILIQDERTGALSTLNNQSVFAAGVVENQSSEVWLMEERHPSLTTGGGKPGQSYPCALVGEQAKCLNPWDVQSKHIQTPDGVAEALYSGECRYGGGESYVMTEDEPIPINTMVGTRTTEEKRTTFGIGEPGDPQFTLSAAHSHAVCCAGFSGMQSAKAGSIGFQKEMSPTIRGGQGGNQVPCVIEAKSEGDTVGLSNRGEDTGEVTETLRAEPHGALPMVFDASRRHSYQPFGDVCETVQAAYGTGGNNQPLVLAGDVNADKPVISSAGQEGE